MAPAERPAHGSARAPPDSAFPGRPLSNRGGRKRPGPSAPRPGLEPAPPHEPVPNGLITHQDSLAVPRDLQTRLLNGIDVDAYDCKMATFYGADGTRLAYHRAQEGEPVICLPGGPMQASSYLGDLGGLSAHRSLVLLDLRGTGESAVPADPASYRCDRLVDDVEALRAHLGRDRIDVLGHSAGGALAVLYAARYPDRISRLALVTPSPRAVGLEITDSDRRQVAELRRGQAWFPDAFAAFERIWSGDATATDWNAIAPFTRGRWDAINQAHHAQEASQKNPDWAAVYYSAGALDPAATRSALARLRARVLLIAGEYDVALPPKCAADYAGVFGQAKLAVQPGGGHFPWLDDPQWFVQTLTEFLR